MPLLADANKLIASPTPANLVAVLRHINVLLRSSGQQFVDEAIELVSQLIGVEKLLPCAPFTIDRTLLCLAERSPSSFARIMAILGGRIGNARKSKVPEACEVVISYCMLNKTWGRGCDERMKMVSDKFRAKVVKRRTLSSAGDSDANSAFVFDLSTSDQREFFNEQYFVGERWWNPMLCDAITDRRCPEPSIAGNCPPMGSKQALLGKYFRRERIVVDIPQDSLFSTHFLFSYSLICSSRYGQAKDCLKALLLSLKNDSGKCAKRTADVNAGCRGGVKLAVKAHLYNLVSFCHLYLGDYTELKYYLQHAASISSAFGVRSELVEFMVGGAQRPDFDVWIAEIEFLGGSYAANVDMIRGFELSKHFGYESVRIDGFLRSLVQTHRLFEKRLVLNIILKNERSILRELMHEDEIDITCMDGGASSAFSGYLMSMIPPDLAVFSFYLVGTTLLISNHTTGTSTAVCGFDTVLEELKLILQKSKETFLMDVATDEDTRTWWKARFELDKRLETLVTGIDLGIEAADSNALLIDVPLLNFPFEVCAVFANRRVFRIPSLSFLRRRVCGAVTDIVKRPQRRMALKAHAKRACVQPETAIEAQRLLRSVDVFYLLDPMNNLQKSQSRLKPLLSRFPGVAGRLCSKEELDRAMETHTLLYFGHGNGYKYLKGCKNKHVGLFGCSSAKTLCYPNFRKQGAIYSYLSISTLVLGCLWDVSDRDLDEMSRVVLEKGRIERSVCRLRYLNGAAMVVYGSD